MNLVLGILIGAGGYWLYDKAKNGWQITWFGWLLLSISSASFVFGFDLFCGSIIEHEMQAGWMGIGLFSVLVPAVLGVTAWRFSIRTK